jgi:tetratricopeptide (TPR) repeat protein
MTQNSNNYGRDQFNIDNNYGSVTVEDSRPVPLSVTLNELPPAIVNWQVREEEQTIAGYFANPRIRLVTIEAAGGYGKSALASRVFEQSSSQFAQRLWANFQQPVDFLTFGRWLGQKFGYEPDPEWTAAKLAAEALNRLAQSRCLLVLDNLETLLHPETLVQQPQLWQPCADFLAGWLNTNGGGTVLLTSQRQIELPTAAWERVPLGGLPIPQGIALLQERGITGSEPDLQTFVGLAEGHPLLLNLAATVLLKRQRQDQEPAEIHTLIQDDVALLRQICELHRGDPEASVGGVLDVGLRQLPSLHQTVLRRVSVYRTAFDLEMAGAMSPEEPLSEAVLRELAHECFVREKRLPTRSWQFSFQPLIQRYLRVVLREQQDWEAAHWGAIAHYTATRLPPLTACETRQQEADLVGRYVEVFHHRCELKQYAAAFAGIYYQGDEHDDLEDFLKRRGFNALLLDLFGRLEREWDATPTEAQDYGTAVLIYCRALCMTDRGDEALALYEQNLTRACENDDRLGEANTLKAIGDVLQFKKRSDEALERYQQALEIYQQTNARLGEGTVN